MNRKKILIAITSFILSIIIFLFLLQMGKNAIDKPITTKIIVAKNDIDKGTKITEDMIKEEEIDGKAKFAVIKSKSNVENFTTREKIYKDEPINKNRITNNINVLVAKENRKEYSLKLAMEDAVAGTLRAGDMVKIIGTQSTNIRELTSEYILKDKNGIPESIKILRVYDINGKEITTQEVPAMMYVLDLSEEQAVILDKESVSRKVKLIKD